MTHDVIVGAFQAMDIYLGACFIFAFLSLVKLAIVKYMHKRVTKRKEQQEVIMAVTPRLPAKVVAVASGDEKSSEEVVHLLTVDSGISDTPESTPIKKMPTAVAQMGRRLTVTPMMAAASQMSINKDAHHDRYWRCMKAFHVISQLILPLAFGGFGIFYFFIYPYVQKQATC